jgi:hypothetical protein
MAVNAALVAAFSAVAAVLYRTPDPAPASAS